MDTEENEQTQDGAMPAQEPITFIHEPWRMTELENQPKAVGLGTDRSHPRQKLGQADRVAAKGGRKLKENWTKT